jgi:hypothetical protein
LPEIKSEHIDGAIRRAERLWAVFRASRQRPKPISVEIIPQAHRCRDDEPACAENLDSDVSVMKSAEDWLRMHTTDSLNSP